MNNSTEQGHTRDDFILPLCVKELITTAFQRLPLKDLPDPYAAQEIHMEIQAIIQSIKDETDEQIEQGGVNVIPNRMVELHGMLEVMQLLDTTPAILCGAIMAMREDLEKKRIVPAVQY